MSAEDDVLRELVDALLCHDHRSAIIKRDGSFGVAIIVDGWHSRRADAVRAKRYFDDVGEQLRAERDRVEQIDREREQAAARVEKCPF